VTYCGFFFYEADSFCRAKSGTSKLTKHLPAGPRLSRYTKPSGYSSTLVATLFHWAELANST
jgi:hypothetical protein